MRRWENQSQTLSVYCNTELAVEKLKLEGGCDWQIAQPQLVATLLGNATSAGLNTTSQIQAMNIDMPLISKNAASGSSN